MTMNRNNFFPRIGQRGMTLVEIMVALAISMFLMYGVMQIFLGSKTSYRLQESMGRMQENIRFASDLLSREISLAGLAPTLSAIGVVRPSFAAVDGAGTNADAITVTYERATDCVGANIANAVRNFSYFIEPDPETLQPVMRCVELDAVGNEISNRETVVEGVENMQFLFGIDTDGDRYANMYVNATTVAAGGNWNNIASVRFALLLNSIQSISQDAGEGTYVLLDAPPLDPADDTLSRRIYSKTVLARNY